MIWSIGSASGNKGVDIHQSKTLSLECTRRIQQNIHINQTHTSVTLNMATRNAVIIMRTCNAMKSADFLSTCPLVEKDIKQSENFEILSLTRGQKGLKLEKICTQKSCPMPRI